MITKRNGLNKVLQTIDIAENFFEQIKVNFY